MITPATAAFAMSLAKGAIKLGTRLDVLLAEKEAVEGTFVLPMPVIYAGPTGEEKADQLRQYLDLEPGELLRGPLGSEHGALAKELKKAAPSAQTIAECYALVFPERLAVAEINPDSDYLSEIRCRVPGLDTSDPDTLAAIFHIAAGRDPKSLNYGMRIGLLVADVVAEFGAENSALFVRDPKVRIVVQAVLERFAAPTLEDFTEWAPLLRHALGAALNGVLDARSELGGDEAWLAALWDVLAEARADKSGGDDFVLGLFEGHGYSLLISKGLSRAATVLADDESDRFKQIASEIIKVAAPLSANSRSFRTFFADHWGDLFRASLSALEKQGPALMTDQPELVTNVMVALVKELSAIPNAKVLSNETLFLLGDAAISAVARDPQLLSTKIEGTPWLGALLRSVVATVAIDGIKLSFSQEGLEQIISDMAGVFGEHPELIIENPGLPRELVGGILRSVSDLPSLEARAIASAATQGALRAISENPGLMDTRYANLIAGFSGRLAELVNARSITGTDASAIAVAAVETMLGNPAMFDEAKGNLASAVLNAVVKAAAADPLKLLIGRTLVETVRGTLGAVAKHGKLQVDSGSIKDFTDQLEVIVADSLTQAADELGRQIDLRGLPFVVTGLVAAWARGDIPSIDPNSAAFREQFQRLLLAA